MTRLNQQYDAIVSLTTHKNRVKNVLRTIVPIIEHNKNVKVVLNVYIEDYKYITQEVFQYIFSGNIELFVSPIDLGPHLKYFFTATRYTNLPIILIDDDIVYPDNFIDEMLECNEIYPDCILSRRPEKITFQQDGSFLHYHQWLRPYFTDHPVFDSLATGVGGILFPRGFFSLNNENINELLQKCKYDDDIYLKVLSIRNRTKIKSIQSAQMYKKILDDEDTQSIALYRTNWNRTIDSFNKFQDEIGILKGLK